MDFVFTKQQKLTSAKQALDLLNSEKSSEKVAFAKNLVAQEGWIEFKKETVYDDGDTYVYWWLVHPSVAELKWQDSAYRPEENGVDPSLYYNLSYLLYPLHPLLSLG